MLAASCAPAQPSDGAPQPRSDDEAAANPLALVAANPSTPTYRLIELAGSGDWEVREAVASNPSTPNWVLIELAKDRERAVLAALLTNPSTPLWVRNDVEQFLTGP